MKGHGLFKRPRRGPAHSPGAQAAERRLEAREVRRYESEYVHALWPLDFHHGSLRVLLPTGQWAYRILLGILDDRSRLAAHAQWYLAEGAEELGHGLSQGFQKRRLPRSILFDNGAALTAKETEQGLRRLSILGENTLPYSPYQNGKQEAFWGQVQGRRLPMLEGVADLSLDQLNQATLAWLDMEDNRKVHAQTGQTPLHRFLNDKEVGPDCPSSHPLQMAFTAEVTRSQRRSDGTFSLEGIRFEIPSRYGHLEKLCVRFAAWDLATVYLSDPKTGAILTLILAGDQRLATRWEQPDGLPIASRIRTRLRLEALTPKQLAEALNHWLKAAGNPKRRTATLAQTLCQHAAGNLRLLMNLSNALLAAASHQEREPIDEKLHFEVFALDPKPAQKS